MCIWVCFLVDFKTEVELKEEVDTFLKVSFLLEEITIKSVWNTRDNIHTFI